MPPPTRAKSACVEAPIPKLSIVAVIWGSGLIASRINSAGGMKYRIRNQTVMSNRAKPTTTKPITAPARKAICKPPFRLPRAALAARAEALVAVFIPKKPHNAEKKPPVKKATGTIGFCRSSSAKITKMINKPPNTRPTARY